MDRTPFGASAVFLRSRVQRSLAGVRLILMVALMAGCGQSSAAPTFALAIQNGSDLTLRLNVVVAPGQKPSRSLEIPAGSGVLETTEAPMGGTADKPIPIAVEIYTETCALIDTVTVGRGTTLVHILADRSIATSETTLSGGSDVVAPGLRPPC
ncbi:MAG: hypothetical protein ABI573_06000 [Chloroflexota bacterium]